MIAGLVYRIYADENKSNNNNNNLDYSANANSGMRQVLYTFPGSHVPFEESQKGC